MYLEIIDFTTKFTFLITLSNTTNLRIFNIGTSFCLFIRIVLFVQNQIPRNRPLHHSKQVLPGTQS